MSRRVTGNTTKRIVDLKNQGASTSDAFKVASIQDMVRAERAKYAATRKKIIAETKRANKEQYKLQTQKNTRESVIAESKFQSEQAMRRMTVKNTAESLAAERKFLNEAIANEKVIKLTSGKSVIPISTMPGGKFRANYGNRTYDFDESEICRDELGRFASC